MHARIHTCIHAMHACIQCRCFYRGLLELSKSFLDAFGLHTPGEQPIEVDVIMSEVNADLRLMATRHHTLPQPCSFELPTP